MEGACMSYLTRRRAGCGKYQQHPTSQLAMTHKVIKRSGFLVKKKKAQKQSLRFERCQPALRSVEIQNPDAFPLDRHRTKVHNRKLLFQHGVSSTLSCHLHAPVSSYQAHFGFSTLNLQLNRLKHQILYTLLYVSEQL